MQITFGVAFAVKKKTTTHYEQCTIYALHTLLWDDDLWMAVEIQSKRHELNFIETVFLWTFLPWHYKRDNGRKINE